LAGTIGSTFLLPPRLLFSTHPFRQRGTGLSDRVPIDRLPTIEQRMDDVRVVMDAAGLNRAAPFGVSEGGPMCSVFAATFAHRTSALVMYGSYAKRVWDPEYWWAPRPEKKESAGTRCSSQEWGSGADVKILAPNADDQELGDRGWRDLLGQRSQYVGSCRKVRRASTKGSQFSCADSAEARQERPAWCTGAKFGVQVRLVGDKTPSPAVRQPFG